MPLSLPCPGFLGLYGGQGVGSGPGGWQPALGELGGAWLCEPHSSPSPSSRGAEPWGEVRWEACRPWGQESGKRGLLLHEACVHHGADGKWGEKDRGCTSSVTVMPGRVSAEAEEGASHHAPLLLLGSPSALVV